MRISRQFGANNALRQPSLFSPQALLGLQSAGGVSTALSGLDFNVEPLEKRELLHGGSHQSPEAMNDHFVYTQQQSSYSLDVLSNDVDPNGDSLVIVDVSQPKYGTV